MISIESGEQFLMSVYRDVKDNFDPVPRCRFKVFIDGKDTLQVELPDKSIGTAKEMSVAKMLAFFLIQRNYSCRVYIEINHDYWADQLIG